MDNLLILVGLQHHFLKLQALESIAANVTYVHADNAVNIDPPILSLMDRPDDRIYAPAYIPADQQAKIPEYLKQMYREFWRHQPYIAPFWGTISLQEMIRAYLGFRGVLESVKPSHVAILHENNFWGKTLAYVAAVEFDIPVLCFQEGILRAADQTTMRKQSTAAEFSTHLFVWDEASKLAYIEAGIDADKIKVTGPIHLDDYYEVITNAHKTAAFQQRIAMRCGSGPPFIVVCPPRSDYYNGYLVGDITDLVLNKKERGTTIVKLHPTEQPSIVDAISQIAYCYDEADPLPLLAAAAMVVVPDDSSTVTYEAKLMGKLVRTGFKNGATKKYDIGIDGKALKRVLEAL